MFKKFNNSRAQANIGEYALLFALVMAFMIGMSIYFKRVLQARIRDASHWALHTVHNRAGNAYNGMLWFEYEPYYLDTKAEAVFNENGTSYLLEAQGTSGIFKKEINTNMQSDSNAITAPPKDAY